MIQHTFSILQGIGETLERRLWRSGVLTWNDFLRTSDISFIGIQKKNYLDSRLLTAQHQLDRANAIYFADTIKRSEHWRLFDVFKKDAVCLDIETNGFMPESGGYTTLVGIFDGYDYQCLMHGVNLTPDNLSQLLSGYKYLITFYGAVFDIPFLNRSLPQFHISIPHFDLCFGARKLGFKGGLKKLEVEFGIRRDDAVTGIDGYEAVKLWEFARQGSSEALALLKLYNREDTVNLFNMAILLYNKLREQTGIEDYL
jgi:uncharacterized protein YprB with RNaseH-like and TPR domain